MIPIAWRTFIMPEFTKPTVITEVADEDCMTAVTPVPRRIPFTGFPASLNSSISIFDPASFFSESPMTDIPKRKSATPPRSETILLTSIKIFYLSDLLICKKRLLPHGKSLAISNIFRGLPVLTKYVTCSARKLLPVYTG